MVKSASTFAFQISVEMAQTHSNQAKLRKLLPENLQDRFIAKNLGSTLQDIRSYLPNKEEIYVVKTHCPLNSEVKKMLLEGEIKAALSYRDPYDIAVSLKDAGEIERRKEVEQQRPYFTKIKSYEDALNKVPHLMKTARSWLDCEGTLRIPFSKIANEPVAVAEDITEYMGISIEKEKIVKIVESYTSDKSLIFEFNKGIEGRGYKELSIADEDPIKEQMDEFITQYLK